MNDWSFLKKYKMLDSSLNPTKGNLFGIYKKIEKDIIESDLKWIDYIGELLEQILRIIADKFSISVGSNTSYELLKSKEFLNVLNSADIDKITISRLKSISNLSDEASKHSYHKNILNEQKRGIDALEIIHFVAVELFNKYYNEHTSHKFNKLFYLEKINNYNYIHNVKDVKLSVDFDEEIKIDEENGLNDDGIIYNSTKLGNYDVAVAYIFNKIHLKRPLNKRDIEAISNIIDTGNEEIYFTLENFEVDFLFDRNIIKKLIMLSIDLKDYYYLYQYIGKMKFKNSLDNDIFIHALNDNPANALRFFESAKFDNVKLDKSVKIILKDYIDNKKLANFIIEYEDDKVLKNEGLEYIKENYGITFNRETLNIFKTCSPLQADIINKYLNRSLFNEYNIEKPVVIYCLRENINNKSFSSLLIGNTELCEILKSEKIMQYYSPSSWVSNIDFPSQINLIQKNLIDVRDLVFKSDKKLHSKVVDDLVEILKKNNNITQNQANDILSNEVFYVEEIINCIDDSLIKKYIKDISLYKNNTSRFLKLLSFLDRSILVYVVQNGYYDNKILEYLNQNDIYLYEYTNRIYSLDISTNLLLKNLDYENISILFNRTIDFDTYVINHKSLRESDVLLLYCNSKFEKYDTYNYIIKLIDDLEYTNDVRIRPHVSILKAIINEDTLEYDGTKGLIKNYIYNHSHETKLIELFKNIMNVNENSNIIEAFDNNKVDDFLDCLIKNPASFYDLDESRLDLILTSNYKRINDILCNDLNTKFYSFDPNKLKHSYFIFRKDMFSKSYFKYMVSLDNIYLNDLFDRYRYDFIENVIFYLVSEHDDRLFRKIFDIDKSAIDLFCNEINDGNIYLFKYVDDKLISKIKTKEPDKFNSILRLIKDSNDPQLLHKFIKYIKIDYKFMMNMNLDDLELYVKNHLIRKNILYDYYYKLYLSDKKDSRLKIIDKYNVEFRRLLKYEKKNNEFRLILLLFFAILFVVSLIAYLNTF